MSTELDIIGITYVFDYGDYSFDITIKSEDILHWELSEGTIEEPTSGENSYIASKIAKDIIFLSWKEESGFQVFNVMNLNTGELISHASADEIFLNPGKVTVRKK
ncbi:MoaF-related domain-containing protein [Candidatus Leptofilum sp.]|uniref:MoaF-related domain-containing protein n=1 Tax=Candidatus Leptofilum sp. TaxID=3241576 RepID=UPI003B5CA064